MSSLKKILALFLAAIMVISLAACSAVPTSLNKEWSYKSDSQEYPVGMYIFCLYSAYRQAYSTLSENLGDKFDSTASILDLSSTFDETDTVYLCKDWIKSEADKICRNLVALDMEIEKYGITLDPEIVESARNQAKDDWYLGPYYEYSSDYSTSYKDLMEPYGISFESYFLGSVNLAKVKQSALFNYFYNKGGVREVPESEIKAYFEKEYTSYSYFTANFFTSTRDESGTTTTIPFSKDKEEDMKKTLTNYCVMLEEGESFENVAKEYMKYAGLEEDPTISNTEILSSTALPDEVAKVLKDLPEGKSKVVLTGTEKSQLAYLLYKAPIKDATEEYLKVDTNYTQILTKLKGDEFVDYMLKITDDVKCQVNQSYIDKCDPKMFESNL